MKYLKIIILLFYFHVSVQTFAQEPSYSILGEEFLSGIDIYNIYQDKNNDYWITSNKGLYTYNGIDFKEIIVPNSKGNSFFNLIENSNGIFFLNLSGQFFNVKNDTVKLYFQLPDSLITPNISAISDDNDDLIVSTNSIFKIDKSKNIQIIDKSNSTINKNDNGIYYHTNLNEYSIIQNQKIKTFPIHNSKYDNSKIIEFNKDLLFFHLDTKSLSLFKNDSLKLLFNEDNHCANIYSTGENLWITYNSLGLKIMDSSYNIMPKKGVYFKNTFFSSFHKDREGNILLGTFGDGIFFIPNPNMKTINSISKDLKVRRITSETDSTIYLGSLDGNIYKLSNNYEVELFVKNKDKYIELLEYLPNSKQLVYDKFSTTFLNLETKETKEYQLGSIKKIQPINSESYIVASNNGICLFTKSSETLRLFSNTNKFNDNIYFLNGFNGRYYSTNFDTINKTIYAGSSIGLQIGKANKSNSFFKIDDKEILATDIQYYYNKIYVGTKNLGILVFQNDKLIENWNKDNYHILKNVKKITEHNKKLYISTDKGIVITSLGGDILHLINKSEGLYTDNIIDFEIIDNTIFIVNQKGLQKIDISSLNKLNFIPSIKFKNIYVNDLLVKDNIEFSHKMNKFLFIAESNSIKYKREISFDYRLLPIEKDWLNKPFNENIIEYKSLPPGDYKFEIAANFRNSRSKSIYFNFTINPPYWQEWWFFLIIGVFVILITVLIYYYQTRKQFKKANLLNEINASKLTAIQSQMNPHFIFNALNSIQDLVLKGDVDNSYKFITKFANLVRKTLNHSDKEFIPFEDEVNLLELYLNIEKLRFKENLNYSLITNGIDNISVPPMLIQPFIENSLLHGLLHKEGFKNINIEFKLDKELICTIEDNGIGRNKSKEIKKRQRGENESFSTNAINKRFKILKNIFGGDLGLKYEDLVDINDNSSGTKVILKIPIKRRF